MRLYKTSLLLCVSSLLAACGGGGSGGASTSLASFNLSSIEAADTDGQATFTWDGDSSGITYTVCEKDTTATNNCSSLGEVTGANSLSVTVNSLISRTTSEFFIYASNGTSTAISNELSLSTDVINSSIQYLKSSDSKTDLVFGSSISLSSDGNTLAVGADGVLSNISGTVYLFRYDGSNWSQQDYVKASNPQAGDHFGYSVSLSSNGNTLVVGHPNAGINGTESDYLASNSGAVYVFRYDDSNWSQQAYVTASNTEGHDYFGSSISLSSDGNTLAVGAIRERSNATGINGTESDNSARDSGAVYVFRYDGSHWSQQAYVKASNTEAYDWFGYDVSLSSDGNTLAVGANSESSSAVGINGTESDNSASNSGAVYVFRYDDSHWSQQAYVKASNTQRYGSFGSSVSLNSDGNTLAVGAFGEYSGATGINGNEFDKSALYSGAAYLFRYDGSDWSQQAYVKASNTDNSDKFGSEVSLSSDGNTLAVGAFQEGSNATGINGTESDNSASNSGAVYVFRYDGSHWSQQAYVKASNTEADDWFGNSLSLSSDGNTLAVGAYHEDSSATGINGTQSDNSVSGSGAVYIY